MSSALRVAVVSHVGKPNVPETAGELVTWLEEKGIKVVMPAAEAEVLGRPELGEPEGVFPEADMVVSLGGDGTLLRTVRILNGRPIPVVGINMGTLGFLSAIEQEELYPQMERVLAGNYRIDERMMLSCRVRYVTGEEPRHLALNEVVVERAERQRMVKIDVRINGALFNKYTADGLILATPTGSTAYSFSAGGPVVSPANEIMVMTPISPHSLFGRSIVLNANDNVEVETPERPQTNIGVDGVIVEKRAIVERITVDRAEEKALLIRTAAEDFYATFRRKLRFWDFQE